MTDQDLSANSNLDKIEFYKVINMAESLRTFEEKREELVKSLKDFFEKNAELFSVNMVFLYGSWAKGTPKDESDIDLALLVSEEVRGQNPIRPLATGRATLIFVLNPKVTTTPSTPPDWTA